MNNSRIILGIFAAMTSLFSFSAGAQEQLQSTAQNQLILEEILVTAQKRQESVQDIPVSVTAISGDMIEHLGITDSNELTKLSPSLTVINNNNKTNTAFSIRGIGTNVFGSGVEQAVALIIDDVAMNFQGQSVLKLSNIERIEVLRGPQSTLFGKAASAGVISVTTEAPSEEFEGSVGLTLTDEEFVEIQGAVSGPISDTLQYRLSGSWSDRDGFIENLTAGQPDLGGLESINLMGKLHWQVTDTVSADLGAYYTEETDDQCCGLVLNEVAPGTLIFGFVPGNFLEGITPAVDSYTVRHDDPPNASTDSVGANLRLNFGIGEYTLLSITAVDSWEYQYTGDIDVSDIDVLGFLRAGNGGFTTHDKRDIEFFSQEIRLLSPENDRYDYVLGLYYSDSESDDNQFNVIPFAPANNNRVAGTEYLGLFGQLNYSFTDKFSASLGLRVFEEEVSADFVDHLTAVPTVLAAKEKDDEVVGKVAFQYFPSDDDMLFASYTRGYKGYGYDLAAGFNQFKADNPAPPEESDSFEIGYKSTLWDQRLQLNVTAFHTVYDNWQAQLLSFDTNLQISVLTLVSAGELATQGVELETRALLTENLGLNFNAAYVKAEINDYVGASCYNGQTAAEGCVGGAQTVDGEDAPVAPDLKFSLILDYQQPLASMSFDLFANVAYTWKDDERFGIDQNPLTVQDSHGVADVRVGIADKGGRYEVTAFVNNAFDENYNSNLFDARQLYGGSFVMWGVKTRNSRRYYGLNAKFNF